MDTRQRYFGLWIGLILIAVLSFTTIAYATPFAQDDSPGVDSVTPVPPLETPEVVLSDPEEAAAMGPEAILAAPSPLMNYQG
ncbi:MAG: hypothetical protein IPK16_25580 [Anaerolineales bacterium]|nr:hypothetical protein [Anaerolineales bacterium]